MQNKFFSIFILILGFSLPVIAQQTTASPAAPKAISGGVLNGKAESLSKPAYPAAARAVNASGAVNVQVTIDENGDIISASAVSGHPLLRQAAEQAARTSKFLPTLLQGQPVRVTGVIVYNFVLPMTFTQIGYELALAEKSKSLDSYQVSSIAGTFPASWEEEKEILNCLRAQSAVKNAVGIAGPVSKPPVADKKVAETGTERAVSEVLTIRSADEDNPLDAASVEAIKQLQVKVENRLTGDDKVLWAFKLGKILGVTEAEIDDESKTQVNISELSQFDKNAPSGISETVTAKIKEAVELSQQNPSDAALKGKLTALIRNLRNVKIY